MIKSIITYLFIGVIFTLMVDWSTEYARKKGIPIPSEAEFDNESRLFAIAIWPIGIVYFAYGYFKERLKKNKK